MTKVENIVCLSCSTDIFFFECSVKHIIRASIKTLAHDTEKGIKFWIIKNYLSLNFSDFESAKLNQLNPENKPNCLATSIFWHIMSLEEWNSNNVGMRAMGFNFSALTVTIFNSQDTNTAERSMCHTPVIRLCREIIVEENVCMWVCLLDGWW